MKKCRHSMVFGPIPCQPSKCEHDSLEYFGKNDGIFCRNCGIRWIRKVNFTNRKRSVYLISENLIKILKRGRIKP